MQKEVMYIHVPVYIQGWLRFKYGNSLVESSPVSIPMSEEYGWVIYTRSVPNPMMKPIGGYMSCSSQLFNLHPSMATEEVAQSVPSEDKRKFFLPVEIFPERFVMNHYIPYDNTVQLTRNGAFEFNQIVKEHFFKYLDEYEHDYARKMKANREKFEFSAMLDEFMFRHDIDIQEKDALLRTCRRRISERKVK